MRFCFAFFFHAERYGDFSPLEAVVSESANDPKRAERAVTTVTDKPPYIAACYLGVCLETARVSGKEFSGLRR